MARCVGRLGVVVAMCGIAIGALAGQATPAGASPSAPPVDAPRSGIKPIHPVPQHASPGFSNPNTLTTQTNGTTLVVTPRPLVYLVFWGSQWSSDPAGAQTALTNFFTGLNGADDTYDTILTQYCEGVAAGTATCGLLGTHVALPTSSILGGTWADNATAAPTTATKAQIAAEATSAANHFGNTTQAPNLNAQYVIVSATGTHPDGFPGGNFCAWHSSVGSAYGTLAYTNLPYVPDLGVGGCTTIGSPSAVDGLLSTETHEYAETVTDMAPANGWQKTSTGDELGDLCVQLDSHITLSTGTFDVQGLWSNAANACVTSVAQLTAPALTASFGAASVPINGTTTLTYNLSNPNASADLTGIGFSDALPAGLVVSTPNGLSDSCSGATVDAVAGAGTVSLTAAALSGGATCSFTVNVTGTSNGNKVTTTSGVVADQSLNGASATASLIVGVLPPTQVVFTSPPLNGPASATASLGPATVQLRDVNGVPVAAPSNTTVTLSSNTTGTAVFSATQNGAATSSIVIPSGSTSSSFFYGDTKAGSPTVTAASAGLTSATQVETIVAGPPASMVFLSPPVKGPVNASASLGPIIVGLLDQFGNTAVAPAAGTTIALSSSTATGTFAATAGGPAITTIKVAATKSSARFFYGDTVPGSPTITTSGAGLGTATQQETITVITLAATVGHSSSPYTLIYVNNSPSVVTVGSLSTTNAVFTLQTDSCSRHSLAPAASCRAEVVFHPTTTGTQTGQLVIPTSNGTVTLALSGSA